MRFSNSAMAASLLAIACAYLAPGRAELRWAARRRIFTLSVQDDVLAAPPAYGKAWLMGIAEAID
jgi:hypothetical protein